MLLGRVLHSNISVSTALVIIRQAVARTFRMRLFGRLPRIICYINVSSAAYVMARMKAAAHCQTGAANGRRNVVGLTRVCGEALMRIAVI